MFLVNVRCDDRLIKSFVNRVSNRAVIFISMLLCWAWAGQSLSHCWQSGRRQMRLRWHTVSRRLAGVGRVRRGADLARGIFCVPVSSRDPSCGSAASRGPVVAQIHQSLSESHQNGEMRPSVGILLIPEVSQAVLCKGLKQLIKSYQQISRASPGMRRSIKVVLTDSLLFPLVKPFGIGCWRKYLFFFFQLLFSSPSLSSTTLVGFHIYPGNANPYGDTDPAVSTASPLAVLARRLMRTCMFSASRWYTMVDVTTARGLGFQCPYRPNSSGFLLNWSVKRLESLYTFSVPMHPGMCSR